MSQQRYYTTQLQAGLGLLEETRQLLQVYQPGMSASQLYEAALDRLSREIAVSSIVGADLLPIKP